MKARLFAMAVAATVFSGAASAEDKAPVELKVVAKTAKYKFDGGGKTAEEYKKHLEDLAAKAKAGELVQPPKALAVDLVLTLTNTTKDDITIYIGGDTNQFTFELTGGAGVVAMANPVAFTADFKLPKAVTLAPGKSHEIPVKAFADGMRGFSRLVFWTGPGEYKLTAKYQLAKNQDGEKGDELKSAATTITVEK